MGRPALDPLRRYRAGGRAAARLRGGLLVGAHRDAEVDATHPLAAMWPRWDRPGVAPLRLRLHDPPTAGAAMLLEEMLCYHPHDDEARR